MAISGYTKAPQELGSTPDLTSEINRSFDLRRQAKQQEEARQEKAKATYLKLAEVDPEYTDNATLQETQAKDLKDFQKFIGDVYFKSHNNPSLDDLLQIQNHKGALLVRQQKIKEGQKQLEQIRGALKTDPFGDKYDIDHAQKSINDWMKGYRTDDKGNKELISDFPQDALLPAQIKDTDAYLRKLDLAPYSEKSVFENVNGKQFKHSVKVRFDEDPEEAAKVSQKIIAGDPKLQRKVLDEFGKESADVQQKNMDTHKNDAMGMIASYAYDKHKDAFFNKSEKLDQQKPSKYKAGSDQPVEVAKDGEELGTRKIKSSYVTPAKVGDINISNEQEYGDLLSKKNKTKDEIEATRVYAQNKRNPKENTVDVPVLGKKHVKSSVRMSVAGKNQFDLDTGKQIDPKDASGQQVYTLMSIEHLPYNEKEHRLASKDEYGSLESLNPGYSVKPFLVGKDVDGKENVAKMLEPSDIKEIEAQDRKFKGSDIKMSLGKQKQSSTPNLKSHTFSGMSYDEAFKKLKATGKFKTDKDIDNALLSKIK
jgi:hypothetical protein